MDDMNKILDGPLKGFAPWGDLDPFEAAIGPYYFRKEAGGTFLSAFLAEARHANADGFVHGGALMSFADYTCFVIARSHLKDFNVTVSLNSDFIAAAKTGCIYYGAGKVVRATRSLVFVSGEIYSDEKTVLTFSAILKPMKAQQPLKTETGA